MLLCKEVGEHLASEKHGSLRPNSIAIELGLDDPNGPSAILAQAKENVAADGSTNLAYAYLLDAWEKVCDGEIEQATFEEHMRWFFSNKVGVYNLFADLFSLEVNMSGLPRLYLGQGSDSASKAGGFLDGRDG